MTEMTESAGGHEGGAGGLPQFDPAWWPGQIVWLLFIFAVVFVLMKWVFVPRVGGAIDRREGQIAGDIAAARKLKEQAEAQAAEASAETAQARARAQKLAADAKARAMAEAAKRQDAEEARLAETMAAAEAGIRAARDKAMANVRGIAADTAQAIVEKLTGQAPTGIEVDRALSGRA
ncbi:MAG: F0F1 ATP synthase subunit B family protein [Caulobacteraceae bacterium]